MINFSSFSIWWTKKTFQFISTEIYFCFAFLSWFFPIKRKSLKKFDWKTFACFSVWILNWSPFAYPEKIRASKWKLKHSVWINNKKELFEFWLRTHYNEWKHPAIISIIAMLPTFSAQRDTTFTTLKVLSTSMLILFSSMSLSNS